MRQAHISQTGNRIAGRLSKLRIKAFENARAASRGIV
jgi:hypothetical protein